MRRSPGSVRELKPDPGPIVVGAMLGFLLWFTGFTVVAGEWCAMWRSRTWNGQEPAFRITLTLLAVLIFVM